MAVVLDMVALATYWKRMPCVKLEILQLRTVVYCWFEKTPSVLLAFSPVIEKPAQSSVTLLAVTEKQELEVETDWFSV